MNSTISESAKAFKVDHIDPTTLNVDKRLLDMVPRQKPGARALMLEDIREGGVRNPLRVRRVDRTIIDGMSRHEIAVEARCSTVPVIFEDIPKEQDLSARVVMAALQTRNLSKWERVRLAPAYMAIEAESARKRMLHESDSENPGEIVSEAPRRGRTLDIVADELDVGSGKVLGWGLRLLKDAPMQVLDALDAGDITISGAYRDLFGSSDSAGRSSVPGLDNTVLFTPGDDAHGDTMDDLLDQADPIGSKLTQANPPKQETQKPGGSKSSPARKTVPLGSTKFDGIRHALAGTTPTHEPEGDVSTEADFLEGLEDFMDVRLDMFLSGLENDPAAHIEAKYSVTFLLKVAGEIQKFCKTRMFVCCDPSGEIVKPEAQEEDGAEGDGASDDEYPDMN